MESKDYKNDDHLLVAKLIEVDDEAWDYLINDMVKPIALSDRLPIREIFQRLCIPIDSIGGELYQTFQKNDFAILKNFRYESKFSSFVYWYIRDSANAVLRKYHKKVEITVSDFPQLDSLKECKKSSDPLEQQDMLNNSNKAFARLWKKNPAQAFVLLLRNDLELSSKEVALFMDKTPGNIDKINQRAKTQLQTFFRENHE